MRFEFKPSFDRSVKDFHAREKEEIKTAAVLLVKILSREEVARKGVGLKHLRGNFWEFRKGLRIRILFHLQGDLVEFILAGNHDDVKRFLKNT